MSVYSIRNGIGVPTPDTTFWPEGAQLSTDFRIPVGRGIGTEGLNLRISMPGVFEEDFSFRADDLNLFIFGMRREPEGFGDPRATSYALKYGNFHQTIPLPPGLDLKRLEAKFHHGVLDVHLPFLPMAAMTEPVIARTQPLRAVAAVA